MGNVVVHERDDIFRSHTVFYKDLVGVSDIRLMTIVPVTTGTSHQHSTVVLSGGLSSNQGSSKSVFHFVKSQFYY